MALLADLVRIDTSNPPGDTRPIADHLKRLFDAAAIPHEIIVAPNGKAPHFIARLKGDGSKRPILLAAHTDVVPADRIQWTLDPFDGIIKDGYLYGRGTLDNKGAVAAFARAMLRIKEDGVPLARDTSSSPKRTKNREATTRTGWPLRIGTRSTRSFR